MMNPAVTIKVFPRADKFAGSFKVFGITAIIEGLTRRSAYKNARSAASEAIQRAAQSMREMSGGEFDSRAVVPIYTRLDLDHDPFPPPSEQTILSAQEALAKATRGVYIPPAPVIPEMPEDQYLIPNDDQTFGMSGPLFDTLVPTKKATSPEVIQLPLGWLPSEMRKRLKHGEKVSIKEAAPCILRATTNPY